MIIIGGIIGGLLFCTYYYYFFIFGLCLFLEGIYNINVGRSYWQYVKDLKPKIITLSISALISMPYWGPLLYSLVRYGNESLQNRWFTTDFIKIFFPFFNVNIEGLLLLIGMVYLFLVKDKIMFHIKLLFVSCYLLYLIGDIMIFAFNMPIMTIKIESMITLLLIPPAAHAVFNIIKTIKSKGYINVNTISIITVIFICFAAQTFVTNLENSDALKSASSQIVDRNAIETFNKSQYKGKVFLTNYFQILAYAPVYSFICPDSHYSHPAAKYHERLQYLEQLSEIKDPKEFENLLANNPYDQIDYIFLT